MTTLNTALTDRTSIAELAGWLSSLEPPDAAAQDVLAAAVDTLLEAAPPGAGAAMLSQMASLRRAPAAALQRPAASGGADTEAVTASFEAAVRRTGRGPGRVRRLHAGGLRRDYDKALAEQYRQQALAGDFSWMPEVQFVDAEVLGGANGAYNADEGVVYINADLAASDPTPRRRPSSKRAGHHLDSMLNTVDTQGDEGEMFRRLLGGETLSASESAAIRAEDDTGTIVVDGKTVAVEFWNPFEAVGDAVQSVGEAIGDAAGAVWDGVTDVAEGVADAAVDVAEGVWGGVKEVADGVADSVVDVALGVRDMTAGFVVNLAEGRVGEAFASVVRGFDRAVFQSVERFWVGGLYGAQSVVNGVTDALGPLGKPIRELTDRAFDVGFTMFDTAFTVFREGARIIPDMATGLVGDFEHAVELASAGRWGDALGQLAKSGLNFATAPLASVFDMGLVGLQGFASVAQTSLFLEPPGRRLTDEEIDYLRDIYGSSLDYDMIRVKPGGALNDAMAAHVIGNTLYVPSSLLNPDGSFNSRGWTEFLAHEVGHIWHNQNGGSDYIHRALGAQLGASIAGSSWKAYYWQDELARGKTFETMNPEAQAELINDIALALADDVIDSNDAAFLTGRNYTEAEVEFMEDVARRLGWGTGAG